MRRTLGGRLTGRRQMEEGGREGGAEGKRVEWRRTSRAGRQVRVTKEEEGGKEVEREGGVGKSCCFSSRSKAAKHVAPSLASLPLSPSLPSSPVSASNVQQCGRRLPSFPPSFPPFICWGARRLSEVQNVSDCSKPAVSTAAMGGRKGGLGKGRAGRRFSRRRVMVALAICGLGIKEERARALWAVRFTCCSRMV